MCRSETGSAGLLREREGPRGVLDERQSPARVGALTRRGGVLDERRLRWDGRRAMRGTGQDRREILSAGIEG